MRAGIILIKDNQILLIHRHKSGKEYFVLPGGGVEEGESPADTAVREAKEETSLDVILTDKFLDYIDPRDNNPHRYYFVDKFSGTLQLGGAEALENSTQNSYELEWHALADLKTLTFYPAELAGEIM
ncbi:MAG: NUDIX domain-containing protein [Patescibacteria group bacterium]